ncbi:hypothetical protein [Methylocucumis oryzae]|uniref:hypothetical protein n=1 Tax=Methylocucumis oryzae TaxID=1632867 RepID=UPI001EF9F12A|nr:hypothetical protein [Methylocucumis oryzae]
MKSKTSLAGLVISTLACPVMGLEVSNGKEIMGFSWRNNPIANRVYPDLLPWQVF